MPNILNLKKKQTTNQPPPKTTAQELKMKAGKVSKNLSKGQPRIVREKISKASKPTRTSKATKTNVAPVDAGWFQDSFRPRIMNPIELEKQLLTLGDHEVVRRHDKVGVRWDDVYLFASRVTPRALERRDPPRLLPRSDHLALASPRSSTVAHPSSRPSSSSIIAQAVEVMRKKGMEKGNHLRHEHPMKGNSHLPHAQSKFQKSGMPIAQPRNRGTNFTSRGPSERRSGGRVPSGRK
jgi:hypothetical protein